MVDMPLYTHLMKHKLESDSSLTSLRPPWYNVYKNSSILEQLTL